MWAVSARRSSKYRRSWSVMAPVNSTVDDAFAAFTLSATPLSARLVPGPTVYSPWHRRSLRTAHLCWGQVSGPPRERMKRSRVTLNTIALELVPPNVDDGRERAIEDA